MSSKLSRQRIREADSAFGETMAALLCRLGFDRTLYLSYEAILGYQLKCWLVAMKLKPFVLYKVAMLYVRAQ